MPEQIAAAEKKAKDLVARAKKGEKFADLARDNSDDVETAKNGGYVGAMPSGVMDKQIEDVVFKEKKGYVSDPFRRPTLFLILKVEDRFEEAGHERQPQVAVDHELALEDPRGAVAADEERRRHPQRQRCHRTSLRR